MLTKYTYPYDEIGRRTSRVQEGTAFAQSSFDAFDYNDRSEVTGSDRYLGTDITDLAAADAYSDANTELQYQVSGCE